MKILLRVAFLILMIYVVLSKNSKNSDIGATSYGIAVTRTNDEYNRNSQNYKKPQMVQQLPPKENLNTGKFEEVDIANVGKTDYYDGTVKLPNLKINKVNSCMNYEKSDCLLLSECGWCSSSNSCIPGNNQGPLGKCERNSFVYAGRKIETSNFRR
jgi:hypothetical protein